MKKLCILLLAIFLLTGCAEEIVYETISDGIETPTLPSPLEIMVTLPEGANSPVFSNTDAGKLYECEDCSVTIQTVEAGDFSGLIRDITGYSQENLQILESTQAGMPCYQTVWTSAGFCMRIVVSVCFLLYGFY